MDAAEGLQQRQRSSERDNPLYHGLLQRCAASLVHGGLTPNESERLYYIQSNAMASIS